MIVPILSTYLDPSGVDSFVQRATCRVRVWVLPLILAIAFLLPGRVYAQSPNWSVDPSSFEASASLVSTLSINDVLSSNPNDVIAAFVGSEVRGVARPIVSGGRTLFFVLIYANSSGETITFKAYDASNDAVNDIQESVVFQANAVTGSVGTPFALNTESSVGPSVNDWSVDPEHFALTMNIVSTVFVDGVQLDALTDRLAAFVGNEVRGAANVVRVDGRILFFLTLYANSEGESFSFRAFHSGSNTVRAMNERITFQSNTVEGTIGAPIQIGNTSSITGSQRPAWSMNPVPFQMTMNVVAGVTVDRTKLTNPNDLLGAFVGAELRGVADPTPVSGGQVFFLTIYANRPGEDVSFRVFDAFSQRTSNLVQTLNFTPNELVGSTAMPYELSTSLPSDQSSNNVASWVVNPFDFEMTMNVVGVLNLNGVESVRSTDKVAAFVNGDVRGVSTTSTVGNRQFFFLTVYGNSPGEDVLFKAFDSQASEVRTLSNVVSFVANGVAGSAGSPVSFTADWPANCVPDIQVEGGLVRVARPGEPTVLRIRGSLPSCAIGSPRLRYAWSADGGTALTLPPGISMPTIQIPADRLVAGATHILKVRVSLENNPAIFSDARLILNVESSPLRARIAGGNRAVSQIASFDVDATGSSDPDNSQTALAYSWECRNSVTSAFCTTPTFAPIILPATGLISIAPNQLSPGIYQFTVTVSAGARTASASVLIEVIPGDAPVVSMIVPPGKTNVGATLTLVGSAVTTVAGGLTFNWTATGGVNLDDPLVAPGGRTSSTLVVRTDGLSPASDYRFRLSATDGNNQSGYAEAVIRTNEPPASGQFLITPNQGTALTTDFSFSATGWTDPESPLRYQLLHKIGSHVPVPLGGRVALPSATFSLPAGDPTDNDRVVMILRVFDELGAVSEQRQDVTVHPPPASIPDLALGNDQPESNDDGDDDNSIPLGSSLLVDGLIELSGVDLDLNGNDLQMGPNATLDEQNGRVLGVGSISTTRRLNGTNDDDIGGLGVGLHTGDDLGDTVLRRQHSSVVLPSGDNSLPRTYTIDPQNQPNGTLSLTISFTVEDLAGRDPSTMICFFFDSTNNTWSTEGVVVTARTATSVTCNIPHLSTWTVGPPGGTSPTYLNAKVFLEGPFSGGVMGTALNGGGLLPTTQPYGSATFSGTAVAYSGTESVTAMPATAVDWVVVELRTSTTAATVAARRAALLLSSGQIVDVDGTSKVSFAGINAGDFYVVVRHRNHLPVMTSGAITLSSTGGAAGGTLDYDYTVALNRAFGPVPMTALAGGKFGMVAGDADADGQIQNDDKNGIWRVELGSTGYLRSDFNLSGTVQEVDRSGFWSLRVGKGSTVPQ